MDPTNPFVIVSTILYHFPLAWLILIIISNVSRSEETWRKMYFIVIWHWYVIQLHCFSANTNLSNSGQSEWSNSNSGPQNSLLRKSKMKLFSYWYCICCGGCYFRYWLAFAVQIILSPLSQVDLAVVLSSSCLHYNFSCSRDPTVRLYYWEVRRLNTIKTFLNSFSSSIDPNNKFHFTIIVLYFYFLCREYFRQFPPSLESHFYLILKIGFMSIAKKGS